ncbi:hypothetical protein TGAM01_v207087 [Trichoderma gamsii]|uniref:Uncharacterized protein n=1 Tax=Trichoderma gamsii TaxID=398673 RepID=A0A2P4ZIF8_9HYPO|nr:hypothetical protein TGAM01_v207087 [Trichoderma gamsii]PON24076.1 hypothetical protein TGAM01_v207087 [Trichoderma gamsii]
MGKIQPQFALPPLLSQLGRGRHAKDPESCAETMLATSALHAYGKDTPCNALLRFTYSTA